MIIDVINKPSIFYKYKPIDKYLFELLRENSFYYSKMTELNDFYDLRFTLDLNFIQDLMRQTFQEQQNASEELRIKSEDEIEKLIRSFAANPNFKHLYHEKLYERLGTKICCFTTNQFSSSMWSFYAKQYSGVVLEFDFREDKTLHSLISEVKYLENIEPIKDLDGIRSACIIKMPEWEREKEWRIIVFGNNKSNFNKSCLKSITFGMKIKGRNIYKINKLIKDNNYPDVKLYQLAWFQNEMKRFQWTEK